MAVEGRDKLRHTDLTNAEWERLVPLLPDGAVERRRHGEQRMVINGVLYQARTGSPWRSLPDRFGCWITVYKRQRRWSADGTWGRLLRDVQAAQGTGGHMSGDVVVHPGAVMSYDVGASVEAAREEGAGAVQVSDPVLASLALRLTEVINMAKRKG
ncbi:transposase [Nonomuraea sp. NPDC051191]|uniref:transposase n=1 Tax=Nonomuraea sp. NPDC051191 TaxID=3364372 RepID=UPI0037AE7605